MRRKIRPVEEAMKTLEFEEVEQKLEADHQRRRWRLGYDDGGM